MKTDSGKAKAGAFYLGFTGLKTKLDFRRIGIGGQAVHNRFNLCFVSVDIRSLRGWCITVGVWGTYEVTGASPRLGNLPEIVKVRLEFVGKRLQFAPDERQTEVPLSGAKGGILNCTRQWGKSTIGAAMAVCRAYTRIGSTVLVASLSGRQSGELVLKAESLLGTMGISARGDGNNEREEEGGRGAGSAASL